MSAPEIKIATGRSAAHMHIMSMMSGPIGSGRLGYVGVPKGHPWHGKGYDEIEVKVFGGLTFASDDVPSAGIEPDGETWWVGFDDCHAWPCEDFDAELASLKRQAEEAVS